MTIVEKHTLSAITITNALKEEIELLREDKEAVSKLTEEEFDPTDCTKCFLAQIYGQDDEEKSDVAEPYRSKIGYAGVDLGGFYGYPMTPLEVWSAYMWGIDKELVLNVFRYIRSETDTLPEIKYEEIKETESLEEAFG